MNSVGMKQTERFHSRNEIMTFRAPFNLLPRLLAFCWVIGFFLCVVTGISSGDGISLFQDGGVIAYNASREHPTLRAVSTMFQDKFGHVVL